MTLAERNTRGSPKRRRNWVKEKKEEEKKKRKRKEYERKQRITENKRRLARALEERNSKKINQLLRELVEDGVIEDNLVQRAMEFNRA